MVALGKIGCNFLLFNFNDGYRFESTIFNISNNLWFRSDQILNLFIIFSLSKNIYCFNWNIKSLISNQWNSIFSYFTFQNKSLKLLKFQLLKLLKFTFPNFLSYFEKLFIIWMNKLHAWFTSQVGGVCLHLPLAAISIAIGEAEILEKWVC